MKKKDWNKKKNKLNEYRFNISYIEKYFETNEELTEEKYFKYIESKKQVYYKKKLVKNYKNYKDIEYLDRNIYNIAKKIGFGNAYKFYAKTFKTSELKKSNIEKLIKYKNVLILSEKKINNYVIQLNKLIEKVKGNGDKRHKDADKQSKATLYALKKVNEFTSLLEKDFKEEFPKYIKIDDKILYTQNYINLLYKMYESHYINYCNSELFETPINQTTFDKNKD